MATALKCAKGSEAPIGVGGKCVYALKGFPLAEQVTEHLQVISTVFCAGIFFYTLNRLFYNLEEHKFRRKPIVPLLIAVLIIMLVGSAFGFVLRLADWLYMSEQGYHAYTIMFMITQGCSLLSVALIVMNFVDRHLLKRDRTVVVKSYNLITKIVCVLFILLALGQVAFYAGITIKYKGQDLKLVKRSHELTLATQCAIMLLSVLMFFVGPIIAADPHANKQVRYRASISIGWAVGTIVLAGINVYTIKKMLLTTYQASDELSPTIKFVVGLQMPLAPYLATNPLLLYTWLLQLVLNLMLLGAKSNELFPFTSMFRWLRYAATGKYSAYEGAGISDHTTDNGASRTHSAVEELKPTSRDSQSPAVRTDFTRYK